MPHENQRSAGRVRSAAKKTAATARTSSRLSVHVLLNALRKDPALVGHPGLLPGLVEMRDFLVRAIPRHPVDSVDHAGAEVANVYSGRSTMVRK